jgi:hypothetical protein
MIRARAPPAAPSAPAACGARRGSSAWICGGSIAPLGESAAFGVDGVARDRANKIVHAPKQSALTPATSRREGAMNVYSLCVAASIVHY